ncbi:MAG: LuxR C-terminal-related transcriptional regulator [Agathobacter sp.]|nr:LuxR C-terminal-related transcriptional regulator [Agathobacter sp.]
MIYSQFDKAVDDKIRNDEKEEPEVKVISEEEKRALFVEKYSLTEREGEVLKALIETDDNAQNIAKQLGFSRTELYRHISNINKKTETSSRLGIIQFYNNSVFNGK